MDVGEDTHCNVEPTDGLTAQCVCSIFIGGQNRADRQTDGKHCEICPPPEGGTYKINIKYRDRKDNLFYSLILYLLPVLQIQLTVCRVLNAN